MITLDDIQAWLQDRLPQLLTEYKVPGAAVAVYSSGQMIDFGAGLLNKATGVAANADSLFQVGSITKVWTTTLVMQLVDEGLVDLDAPVRTYVPAFRLADESAAATITVRQLLCHTAGFEGDVFTDTGKGDDCVEKYVATLGDLAQLFPPGEMFSYNNAGFCVLGRVVEVVRGRPFDDCVRERLFAPLGLTHAATGPYEAIMYRAALGHIQPNPDDEPRPAPVWGLARSNAPAGSMLAMRPRDLLSFARMHLDSGTSVDGTAVLSAAAVKAMQERQVELPYLGMMGSAWGLGWEIFDWPGGTVIGHDGGTIGQAAFLRVVPVRDLAIALLTNGGDVITLYRQVFGHVLRELGGIDLPELPKPPLEPAAIDASRYVGTYGSRMADNVVSQDADGRVWVEQTPKDLAAELGMEPSKFELVALDGDTLIVVEPQHGMYPPYAFVGDDGAGHTKFLHTGRADPRVST
jgi:CubicO group peptidase (beta-lactamase class C family)